MLNNQNYEKTFDETQKDMLKKIDKALDSNNPEQHKVAYIELIIAMNALYRPGPMDYIKDYINGKLNPKSVVYDSEMLKPILEVTYGVIVFQEQVMQIFRDLAGYSWGRSDLIRRAMSKKHEDEIKAEREIFIYGSDELGITGCIKNHICSTDEESLKAANNIYDKMYAFAKYAFNKSHATSYAITSFKTAYCKYYYPAEYFCSVMNWADKIEKVAEIISDAKDFGIEILPPDVNKSEEEFSIINGKIIFGLSSVKSVGKNAKNIIEARKKDGVFKDFKDFMIRCQCNKSTLKALNDGGAFDSFGYSRQALSINNVFIEEILNDITEIRKKQNFITAANKVLEFVEDYTTVEVLKDRIKEEGISYPEIKSKSVPTKNSINKRISTAKEKIENLYEDIYSIEIEPIDEYPLNVKLANEKNSIGIYISGHPIDEYERRTANISDIESGCNQTTSGIITNLEVKRCKNGSNMYRFSLEDTSGSLNCICFDSSYQKIFNAKELLINDKAVQIYGTVERDDFRSTDEEEILQMKVTNAIPLKKKTSVYRLIVNDFTEWPEIYKNISNCISKDGNVLYVLEKISGEQRKVNVKFNNDITNIIPVKKYVI